MGAFIVRPNSIAQNLERALSERWAVTLKALASWSLDVQVFVKDYGLRQDGISSRVVANYSTNRRMFSIDLRNRLLAAQVFSADHVGLKRRLEIIVNIIDMAGMWGNRSLATGVETKKKKIHINNWLTLPGAFKHFDVVDLSDIESMVNENRLGNDSMRIDESNGPEIE